MASRYFFSNAFKKTKQVFQGILKTQTQKAGVNVTQIPKQTQTVQQVATYQFQTPTSRTRLFNAWNHFNSIASRIGRQAAWRYGRNLPLFSFAGLVMAHQNFDQATDIERSPLLEKIGQLSLGQFEFGQLISQGSNAAVFEAHLEREENNNIEAGDNVSNGTTNSSQDISDPEVDTSDSGKCNPTLSPSNYGLDISQSNSCAELVAKFIEKFDEASDQGDQGENRDGNVEELSFIHNDKCISDAEDDTCDSESDITILSMPDDDLDESEKAPLEFLTTAEDDFIDIPDSDSDSDISILSFPEDVSDVKHACFASGNYNMAERLISYQEGEDGGDINKQDSVDNLLLSMSCAGIVTNVMDKKDEASNPVERLYGIAEEYKSLDSSFSSDQEEILEQFGFGQLLGQGSNADEFEAHLEPDNNSIEANDNESYDTRDSSQNITDAKADTGDSGKCIPIISLSNHDLDISQSNSCAELVAKVIENFDEASDQGENRDGNVEELSFIHNDKCISDAEDDTCDSGSDITILSMPDDDLDESEKAPLEFLTTAEDDFIDFPDSDSDSDISILSFPEDVSDVRHACFASGNYNMAERLISYQEGGDGGDINKQDSVDNLLLSMSCAEIVANVMDKKDEASNPVESLYGIAEEYKSLDSSFSSDQEEILEQFGFGQLLGQKSNADEFEAHLEPDNNNIEANDNESYDTSDSSQNITDAGADTGHGGKCIPIISLSNHNLDISQSNSRAELVAKVIENFDEASDQGENLGGNVEELSFIYNDKCISDAEDDTCDSESDITILSLPDDDLDESEKAPLEFLTTAEDGIIDFPNSDSDSDISILSFPEDVSDVRHACIASGNYNVAESLISYQDCGDGGDINKQDSVDNLLLSMSCAGIVAYVMDKKDEASNPVESLCGIAEEYNSLDSSFSSDQEESPDENTEECTFGKFNLAVKIMFNYGTKEMERETIPARLAQSHKQMETWQDGHKLRKKRLPPHPNIVEMWGVFVGPRPYFRSSHFNYPAALQARNNLQGIGRNMTLFLVMKKYQYTLRKYLSKFNPSLYERLILLAQLLEAVCHMRRNDIAHRDLTLDNIFLDTSTAGTPQLVVGDFGCCLADDRHGLRIPYRTEHMDRGGNTALMAPEISISQPGPSSYLDYSKSDLWATGTLAYEILGADNPFFNHANKGRLDSRTYSNEELPPLPDGIPEVVKQLVSLMLDREASNRPEARCAADVLHVFLWMPSDWLSPGNKLSSLEVDWWLIFMATEVLLGVKSAERDLKISFLKNINMNRLSAAFHFLGAKNE